MHEAAVHGEWVSGDNAGGRDPETFGDNTQYVCVIADDKTDEDGTASCVISLLQKGGRTRMGRGEGGFHDIGMIIQILAV